MLGFLRVTNLGVLSDAVIEPVAGLTVITGETGAGKTLLLGGLRLLCGEKADPGMVGPDDDHARAEAMFSGGEEFGATRVVPVKGNSRARLDGSLVSAGALGDAVGSKVEIVGQHDQLRLTRPSQVLHLVDGALDERGLELVEEYQRAWSALASALDRQSALGGDEMSLRRELDLVSFQAGEIETANLDSGEDESLELLATRLRNAEETRRNLAEALRLLDSTLEDGGEVVSRTRNAGDLDPSLQPLVLEAESVIAQLSELRGEIRASAESLHSDPQGLEEIEARLTAIGDLKMKYGRTVSEIVSFGKNARSRAEELEELLTGASSLGAEIAALREHVAAAGQALNVARSTAAERLSSAAAGHLHDLALGRAEISVVIDSAEPGPSGSDRARVLFRSDPGLPLNPLDVSASGGELSRLVLALRLAARSDESTTLVFDEIDTGIGGATALAMGRKLAELSRASQVLCVTHLPQVAAFSDAHYVVERRGGTAVVKRLQGDDRLQELARMLAGLPDSEAGHLAASELLAVASA